MFILLVISIFVLVNQPIGGEFQVLENTYALFGLGLNSSVLILSIGLYLLYRWIKGGRENSSQLVWGICWILYSWTFIGHILRALGVIWANDKIPTIFFMFRWVMIIFAAGLYYGISHILTENKKIQIIPSFFIFGVGISWFIIGLFGIGNIETTMYVFLYCIWSPILFSIAYTFYIYGKDAKMKSPYLISLGFIGIGITYLAWAPWHLISYLYMIWYFLFQLSLVPVLLGFVLLTSEFKKNKS